MSCNARIEPTCKDLALENVDWTYCDPIRLYKCGNRNDTLTRKTLRIMTDETGPVVFLNGYYCIETEKNLSVQPLNLPPCFKRNGLRIKFSCIVKATPTGYICGTECELTKIEEVP